MDAQAQIAALTEIRDKIEEMIAALKPAEPAEPAEPAKPMIGGQEGTSPAQQQTPNPVTAILTSLVPLPAASPPVAPGQPVVPSDTQVLAPTAPGEPLVPSGTQVPAPAAPGQSPFSIGGAEMGNLTSYGQGRRGTYRRRFSRKRTSKR